MEPVSSSSRYDYKTRGYIETPARIKTVTEGDIGDYLVYVQYQKKYEAAIATYEAALEEYERRKSLITVEATKVEDAIVLGDNAAALAALQSFAAFTV